MFDTHQGFISVTERRISKLKSSINLICSIDCKSIKVRDLASVVGQVISLTPCVAGVARIMTRSMYATVNQKLSWNSDVELTKEACTELAFWSKNVDYLNFHCPWAPLQPPAKFVYSDASDHACSSFIDNEHKIFHQNWSPAESSKSSTWRELRTVDLALSAFALDLQGKKVAWFIDNTSVPSIVHNGSKVTDLQSLALSVFNVCARSGISLEMKWIPGSFNCQADLLSRTIDFDDYTINDNVFHMLDCKWGRHTVDRFACSYNAKISRYNSRFYQPGAEAVDAFTQTWDCENNWILPPVSQISRVIFHARACKAVGTLVIPMWKSSYFWVLLRDDGNHWNAFVHYWITLPRFKHLFIRGRAKNRHNGSKDLSFSVVALRLNFKRRRSQFFLGFCIVECSSCAQCNNC